MRKAALHNLGCKVNAYETESMQQILEAAGYEIVPFDQKADVYVINTCSVTNIADRKSRQMLHRARKKNPDSVVVAAGCYVQTAAEQAKLDESIDILIGNNKKHELVELLEEFFAKREGISMNQNTILQNEACENRQEAEQQSRSSKPQNTMLQNEKGNVWNTALQKEEHGNGQQPVSQKEEKAVEIVDISKEQAYEELTISRTAEHTRAFIKVQDGCNQFCSYCIIPYARGRVRSRRLPEVIKEVEALAKNGYREVVLTGIHLSSYGIDFPESGINLLTLIQKVHEIAGIERIRLGSLEPKIITEEFVKKLSKLPKVCPHFHLSLQSGCDATLKRMNRKYTCEEYKRGCDILRRYFEHPAITTDVIVGFPGETEEEFEITRKFLKEIAFFEIHIFKYSVRKGTKAATMEQQVPEEIKSQRSDILFADLEPMNQEFLRWYQGKCVEALLEERIFHNGKEYFVGHTKEYVKTAVLRNTEERLENKLIQGTVQGFLEEASHILLLENVKV